MKNRTLIDPSVEDRIDTIMARMSLDQKIGQMTQPERMAVSPEEVKTFHIGSVLSGGGSCPGENFPKDWVKMNDEYWAASMEEDDNHLAIPLIYGIDAIHGNNNIKGSTIFPHNIGLGAANDPDLLYRVAHITALEILATGVEWTFAPTLAVVRNDHWGRTYESYSEHPDIVCSYSAGFIKGLQQDLGDNGVVACAKHWIGDGGTTSGIDRGDTDISEEELRRLHLPPYIPAIEEGVLTVMASFNSWNGEKCHGSKYLLTDLLKSELGFNGFIISDWDGIDFLHEDYFEAVALGVESGMDMFMVSVRWKEFIQHVRTHVEQGRIPMERIDDAVRRILRVKLLYGLFEKPRPAERPYSLDPGYGSESHREVAREAVRKSLVLLKNDHQILPLNKEARILVAGKNANNRGHQCGGFTVDWQGVFGNDRIIGGTSIWEGIHNIAPNAELSPDGSGDNADPEKHDVAIVVIGEVPYAEGFGDVRKNIKESLASRHGLAGHLSYGKTPAFIVESDSDEETPDDESDIKAAIESGNIPEIGPYGKTLDLAYLHPEDLEVIKNITSKGIPVVTVLISGRPLVINPELAASDAFVAAWLPGSEGQGIADVIFGDYNFQGRLSFSWPTKDSDNINLGDHPYEPLFPYGFGLTI